jgi:hypothetical protein
VPTKTEYWNGSAKVELSAADVEPKAMKDDRNFTYARGVMNNAFRIWHDARGLISNVSDVKIKSLMAAQLNEAGYNGAGGGVDDLDEAFDHLAKNSGKWKDSDIYGFDTSGWYAGGKIGGVTKEAQVGYVKIPEAVGNFLDSLNEKAKTLAKNLKDLQHHGSTVLNTVKPGGVAEAALPRVGSAQWTQMGEGLKWVDKAHQGAAGLLWLAAADEKGAAAMTHSALGELFGAVGKVRGAVETYDKARTAGWAGMEGAGFTAICEGMAYLPVLGSYYKAAFETLPGISAGFTAIVQKRNALAAQLGVDLRTTH